MVFNKLSHYIALLVGLSVVIWVLLLPASLHLNTHLLGSSGDNLQFFGWTELVNYNLSQGNLPFSDMLGSNTLWRYPSGFAFSRNIDAYLFLLINMGLSVLVSADVLRFNLAVLLLFVLNACLAYPLFSKLGRSRLLGLTGAVIYGFSFQSLARNAGHVNLLFTGGLPLFVYAILNLVEQKKITFNIWILGLAVLVTSMGSLQYLLILIGALPFALLLCALFYPKKVATLGKVLWQHNQTVLTAVLIYSLVLVLFIGPTLWGLLSGAFVKAAMSKDDLYQWAPSLWNYLLPNGYIPYLSTRLVGTFGKPGIDFDLQLGWAELVLFLLFVTRYAKQKLTWLVVSVAAFFFVFSLGTRSADFGTPLPYSLLIHIFPYWGVAESTRWYVVMYLAVVSGGMLFLGRIKKTHLREFAAALVLTLAVLERLSFAFPSTAMNFLTAPYLKVVKEQTSSAVLDLPVDFTWAPVGNIYNAISAYNRVPMVNGYLHWSAETTATKQFLFDSYLYRYMCKGPNQRYYKDLDQRTLSDQSYNDTLVDYLRKYNISTVVVHKFIDSHLYFEECNQVLRNVSQLLPLEYTVAPTGVFPTVYTSRHFTGVSPNLRLVVPSKGTLKLHYLKYLASAKNSTLAVTINGVPLQAAWKLQTEPFEDTLVQTYIPFNDTEVLELPVSAGTVLTFSGQEALERRNFFILAYTYLPSDTNQVIPESPGAFRKVYDDDSEEVYVLK